jgi:hypothetical protein
MRHAANLVVFNPTSSRLKPVLQTTSPIVPTLRVGMHHGTLRVHTRRKPVLLTAYTCRTGFSREDAGVATGDGAA